MVAAVGAFDGAVVEVGRLHTEAVGYGFELLDAEASAHGLRESGGAAVAAGLCQLCHRDVPLLGELLYSQSAHKASSFLQLLIASTMRSAR